MEGLTMVSKKQKVRTVILVLLLAIAIVGGVFAISYYKGGVTFPWQVTAVTETKEEVAEEPQDEKLTVTVVEPEAKEETKKEAVTEEKPKDVKKVEETTEETPVEETPVEETTAATVDNKLDYYGQLHVEDGVLVDAEGETVQLTGVSSHGLSWYPEYVTADSIKALRDNWGINVIRLAMYTSDYNGYCVAGEEIQSVLKDNIDEAVTAATENDMYVIIDWHILNDGNPNEYKSQAIQFFGEIVRKYEDNENVIYEICNEPNGDTTWEDIKKYANEVIPVIRNVDEDALILVGTPSYSSDLDSVLEAPLDFDNIMYTYHFYAGTHKSSARNSLTNALDAGLPVFISEYGLVSADGDGTVDTKEAEKWIDILKEYNLSSCIWNLSNKAEGSALISADCDKTADFEYEELSEQGQYFFDLLQNNKSNTENKR
ncbi:MAG: glycoside hydrolase family 5 protein [Pseudobutyrivibrio ruminis]|nr:glycoside hydrolase family 5 protein [Pseudobutyrivibrio ruminis]